MSAPSTTGVRRLSRAEDGRPAAPVRIVHLGLGNFFRAHQAWYTEHAPDAGDWGIAAFTGRSTAAADRLNAHDALYTLLVRGPDGPGAEVISSLSAVHAGADLSALRAYFASPEVVVVTSTVTEAGYRRNDSGDLDLDDPDVAADIAALRSAPLAATVATTPGRLVAGLLARRDADAGPLAVVPCDNVPDNGAMVHRVVTQLGAAVDPTLVPWIEESVSFVTTMVDRITPRATDADVAEVRRLLGVEDPETVVTEPFVEWVLAGDFPGGRPAWDEVGARFVADVHPFETRKLWLLNGAHSILAYAGSVLGHETVADAMADPRVAAWVDEWWDCASRHLTLPAEEVSRYRQALVDRFTNPQIRHLLAQIAADGSQKVPIRGLPVLRAARESGDLPPGPTRFLAAWIANLRGLGAPVVDVAADELVPLASGPSDEAVERVLAWLGVDDVEVTALVSWQLKELEAAAATT